MCISDYQTNSESILSGTQRAMGVIFYSAKWLHVSLPFWKTSLGVTSKRLHSKCFHIDCHSQRLNSVFWSTAPLGLRRDLYKHSAANCKTDVSISFYVGVNCGTLCFYLEAFFLMEVILAITHAGGNCKTGEKNPKLFSALQIYCFWINIFSKYSFCYSVTWHDVPHFGLAMNNPVCFHPWLFKWE